MKKLVSIMLLMFLCSATFYCLAQERDITHISKSFTYRPIESVGDFNSPITAYISYGKVFIRYDEDKAIAFCRNIGKNYPFTDRMPLEVQGLAGDCASLTIADIGQDVNPVIAMSLTDGSVQILDFFNALSTGDLCCSLPLKGVNDVLWLDAGSVSDVDEDGNAIGGYVTIFGHDETGKKHEIKEYNGIGSFYPASSRNGNLVLSFSRDWKLSCKVNGATYSGRFSGTNFSKTNPIYSYVLTSSTVGSDTSKINIPGTFSLVIVDKNCNQAIFTPITGFPFSSALGKPVIVYTIYN
jgi:hypothetical protein